MSDLADARATLTRLLPIAEILMTQPDTDTHPGHSQPTSRPPWNSHAATAYTDAHAGVRHRELTMRYQAGLPPRRRGGSTANTYAALGAIEKLSHAVTDNDAADAAWHLDQLTRPIRELPAVDETEPWRKMPGVACPYCGFAMLRVKPRAGEITCLRYGACFDSDGRHPAGHMDVSPLTADPLIRWNDGRITP